MDPVTVLITGIGAPGFMGTRYALLHNPDHRPIKIIGTDIQNSANKCFCDQFYQIAPAGTQKYLHQLFAIVKKERVQVILPQNTAELVQLSAHRSIFTKSGCFLPLSIPETLIRANNKAELYALGIQHGVNIPAYQIVHSYKELQITAKLFGYPAKQIVIKPLTLNGSRGLRILIAKNKNDLFWNHKPADSGLFVQLEEMASLDFRMPLMVSKYLPGKEYTVDCLQMDKYTVIIPRKRTTIKNGISWDTQIEHHTEIIEQTKKLIHALDIEYVFGFQFKLDGWGKPYLLECNPRIQGTMVSSVFAGANIIYALVQKAMGETLTPFTIDWNTSLHRYWGAYSVQNYQLRDQI